MANQYLPASFTAGLQTVPDLLQQIGSEQPGIPLVQIGMIYQVDSISRTLHRSDTASTKASLLGTNEQSSAGQRPMDITRPKLEVEIDDVRFRAAILETQVLNTVNFLKWRWDSIQDIVEGPLLNPKRLSEAINGTKFLKRLIGFYRPFKYRFSDVANTKANQRYVRIGVSLTKTLLQNAEGVTYLSENKLLRQLGECLAQLDRVSLFSTSLHLILIRTVFADKRSDLV